MNFINKPSHPFLLFVGCTGLGVLFFIIFSIALLAIKNGFSLSMFSMDTVPRNILISIQITYMITMFIIPPVLFAVFSKNEFLFLFHLNNECRIKKYLFAGAFALCLFPFLISLSDWLKMMPLPDDIRAMADNQEKLIEVGTKTLLNYPGFLNFILMLLIVGIGAGITEELYFRGLFMPLLSDMFQNKWAGIVLSAVLFALLHLSIYKFIPILLVGIVFGYLFYQTGDLKLNIFIHSIFNGSQVILNYLNQINIIPWDIDEVKSVPLFISIPCLIGSVFFYSRLIQKDE